MGTGGQRRTHQKTGVLPACGMVRARLSDTTVIPAQAGIQLPPSMASLTLRAALWAFNALRAFVRPAPE